MINQINIIYWCFLSLVLGGSLFTSKNPSEFLEVPHKIMIKHPGEKNPVQVILFEIQNEAGFPVQYRMDVNSVICLAQVCKVIPVTLYWSNTGQYQRYELQKEATLEKYEADLFETDDYVKLDAILKNDDSPFKDVYIEDIWTVPSTLSEEVDAISGATILELDEKDTVPGAALTCYTLWHWANGNIVSEIKNCTSISVSNEQLEVFISHRDVTYFDIALQALQDRNLYKAIFVDAVMNRILKNEALLDRGFTYLEKAPIKTYLQAASVLFFKGEKLQKLAAMRSLLEVDTKVSVAYLEKWTEIISTLGTFQEVSALLDLIEKKDIDSEEVNTSVIPLLQSEFLIARRAYWFLYKQRLNPSQIKVIKAFQKKYKARL